MNKREIYEELKETEEILVAQIEKHEETERVLEAEYKAKFAEREEMNDFILDMDSYKNELERDIEICTSILKSPESAPAAERKTARELRKKIKEDKYNLDILAAMRPKTSKLWLEKNKEVNDARLNWLQARSNVSVHKHKLEIIEGRIEALGQISAIEEENEG